MGSFRSLWYLFWECVTGTVHDRSGEFAPGFRTLRLSGVDKVVMWYAHWSLTRKSGRQVSVENERGEDLWLMIPFSMKSRAKSVFSR